MVTKSGKPEYEMYKDTAGEWRWRLRATNGKIVASGESYKNKADCKSAIDLIKNTSDSLVVEKD